MLWKYSPRYSRYCGASGARMMAFVYRAIASSTAFAERIRSATCDVVTGSFGFFSRSRRQIAAAAARRSASGLAVSFRMSLPHSRNVSGLLGSALSIASKCVAAAA